MIYIAGKIQGLPFDEVKDKFQKVENALHREGLKVINPLKLGIPFTWPYREQIDACLKVIAKDATAIYLLNDWKDSPGAKEEFQYVAQINTTRRPPIMIYFEDCDGIGDVMRDVRDGILTCVIPEET